MISIVFKAYKKTTNEPFIIKMKKNKIEEKLNEAINNLKAIIYIISFFPLFNNFDLNRFINKNIESIKIQTNFKEEILNMMIIKNNCKNLKYVKIPNVNKEITEKFPNIILMEYIEGLKFSEIDKSEYEFFAKNILKFGFVSTMIHGITHGDLHCGNIIFIKDNEDLKNKYKIGIIDFGFIYKIPLDLKNNILDIFADLFSQPTIITSSKILNSGLIEPKNLKNNLSDSNYNTILNFTNEIIKETIFTSKKANQLQIYKFLIKFKEFISNSEVSKLGLKLSDFFLQTQLVLAMSHGLTITLCQDEFIKLADCVLNELFNINLILDE